MHQQHCITTSADIVITGLLQQAKLQVTHTVQQCCSPMFEMRLTFYKRDMTNGEPKLDMLGIEEVGEETSR